MESDWIFGLFLIPPLVSGRLAVGFFRAVRAGNIKNGAGRIIAGNLIVLLFLASAIFAGGEAYYRFAYDATDSFDYSKASKRWFARHFHLNSWAVRDDMDYRVEMTPGKRRIMFLGDSFTAGHGVKEVGDRFANRLRRDHPEWEIHVLARIGYDTGDERQAIGTAASHEYQFDEVVLVYCLNDIADLDPKWKQAVERIFGDLAHPGWLRRNSYFADMVWHRLKVRTDPDMKNYYQFVQDSYRGPLWAQQQERLRELRQSIESRRGHLSVVTFPFLHALGPKYEYQFVHEQLRQFWREEGVPQLDLLSIYKDLPPAKVVVNQFDAHPNEFAHALAAEALDKFLREQVIVPRGAGAPPPGKPDVR